MRLALTLGRTPRELIETTDRGEILELIAYDVIYGLPDRGERKLPNVPPVRRSKPARNWGAVFEALKHAYGKQ